MLRNVLAGLLALCFAVSAHAADQVPLKRNNGIPATFSTTDTVGVAHGGTGLTALTAHCVTIGAGTSAAHLVCPTMSGYVLTDNGAGSDPSFQAASGGGGTPGGTNGQIQYNNAGSFGGFTLGNDCTFSVPNITCTKLNSVSPGYFFSGTDAANLTGTAACARLPALTGDVTTSAGTCATTIGSLKVATGMIQASAVTEGKIGLSNVTTNNVTTTAHGFAPILPNDATKFLDGTGNYTVPGTSPAGQPYSVPNVGTLTWVNQGTATATQAVSGSSIFNVTPCNATQNWRGLFLNVPGSTPYKLKVQFTFNPPGAGVAISGLYFYDGTKLYGTEYLYNAGSTSIRVEKITDVNHDGSTPQSAGASISPIGMWFQLRNDGTKLYFDTSMDGVNFGNLWSENVGTYMTPTKYGFAQLCTNGTGNAWWLNWITANNANLN